MPYDFQKEEDVQEYIKNLGIEYRFECFKEKKPDGCHRLADYLEAIKKEFEKALDVYRTNCDDNKYGKSCFKYGNYKLIGKGCTEDKPEAFNYYRKGCDAGCAQSCFAVGLMLTSADAIPGVARDNRLGMEFLDKACTMGNAEGCYFASGQLIAGNRPGVPRDMRKAFGYTERACELGNMYACSNLSLMYAKGEGVTKDEEKARAYRQKVLDFKESMQKRQRTIEMEQGITT